ncbi:GNAT family N-acetyltransferase [Sporolactobacillus inulinus]|uniref:GNAT family acetyltransferase YhhY n=2 Tax=Sporolactobacillus inulinus TaxID=2078 RepID=A0A4Y1ZC52_9BACL|nr:GNAT family N-acetyltransferase [Sporolactobacillus inulinus]KLI03697.1 acetyltransferase [Sporolactobacillus inulinus CASD]GAY76594.1 GNAT family acetyltransferase YhhY [Sporolactobacillus inulinus]GEB77033.1 acetyltransferase [Sporolactobacillus inulinus]
MSESKRTIREARKSDAAPVLAYLSRIAGETDFLTYGSVDELQLTVEKEEALFERYAKKDNAVFLVAEYDGTIVGTLNFEGGKRRRTAHVGEFGISVRKDYWGKGIGRALLSHLIHWSKKTGIIRKINLMARSDNIRAIKLYESFGFVQDGLITRDLLIDGVFYSAVHMGLLVD